MSTTLIRTYAEPIWLDDLDPTGRETASDLASLEQDVLHLLRERLGSNMADPAGGVGVLDYLSGTSNALQTLPSIIDAQLSQDDRITNSRTEVSQESDGTYRIAVDIAVAGAVVALVYEAGPDGVSRV